MQTITLGRTGLAVWRIAFGTWQLGGDWGRFDEAAAVAAVRRARESGVNFFETAQAYGFGASERLLGAALRTELTHHRDQLVIATKGGLRRTEDGVVRDASPRWLRAGDWRATSALFTGEGFRRTLAAVVALQKFAAGRGITVSQLAIAWTLANPAVHAAIVGARQAQHVEDSLAAADLALSTADLADIDADIDAVMTADLPVAGPTPERV